MQLGGVGYKHAGSDRWASHSRQDNSSWGSVTRLLPGGPGLLVLPWYTVVCRRRRHGHPCQQSVVETASARSTGEGRGARLLQWPCGGVPAVEEGVSHGAGPRYAWRPSGRQRHGSGWRGWAAGGAGLGTEHFEVFDWKQIEALPVGMGPVASQQDWGAGAPVAHPSLVPTGCVRGGKTAPLLWFLLL